VAKLTQLRFASTRRSLTLAAAALGLLATGTPAQANYASIVVDAESGAVLEQEDADTLNYPASLTKMMTLYLLFEALDAGKVRLAQEFPVSPHAAAQAPSKLGLVPGETVSVHDLTLAVVTKSANDAAVVIAEGIAGSESAFAERMTERARQLGMRNTYFHNASGLPDRLQQTTARDLALLGRALYRDFPKHFHYFSTRSFVWRGAVFANHNHLMSVYPGMDGIKTGYIQAVGFNLVGSAVRNGRRLIGVVMGGTSPHARDRRMAELLDEGFATGAGVAIAQSASSEPSQEQVAPVKTALAAPTAPVSPNLVAAASPSRDETLPAPEKARHHLAQSRKPLRIEQHWAIQLGAYTGQAAAQHEAYAAAKLPVARGKRVQVVKAGSRHKPHTYRAQLVSFSRHEAETACRMLLLRHHSCTIIPASGVTVASR
jgi:D-alanyl-D-alanine carboxypeptidase